MPNLHTSLAKSIIKHQESIVGPISWSEANKVNGLSVKDHKIKIDGDGKKVLENLVTQYSTLFGRASIEACKDAIRPKLSDETKPQIPKILL